MHEFSRPFGTWATSNSGPNVETLGYSRVIPPGSQTATCNSTHARNLSSSDSLNSDTTPFPNLSQTRTSSPASNVAPLCWTHVPTRLSTLTRQLPGYDGLGTTTTDLLGMVEPYSTSPQ